MEKYQAVVPFTANRIRFVCTFRGKDTLVPQKSARKRCIRYLTGNLNIVVVPIPATSMRFVYTFRGRELLVPQKSARKRCTLYLAGNLKI